MGSQIFISYVDEDGEVARGIAEFLETAGYTTWYYERDSFPGVNYLKQTGEAIDLCQAIVVLITPDSIQSQQVTSEVIRAHESKRLFIPVLRGLTHAEFQQRCPEWRQAIGAATSVKIPDSGLSSILNRLIGGLRALGIQPASPQSPPIQPLVNDVSSGESFPSIPDSEPHASPGSSEKEAGRSTSWPEVGGLHVRLEPRFDHTGYHGSGETIARFLLELEVEANTSSDLEAPVITADIFLVLDVSGSMNRPDRYPLLREAVEQFLLRVDPDDCVGVAVFSEGTDLIQPPTTGAKLRSDVLGLLRKMNDSKMLFGRHTMLAPGLRTALAELKKLESAEVDRVRRVYVLTDGELHDTNECDEVLREFDPSGIEIHVYGFGDAFDAAALKRLVSDHLGGSVKPICDETAIVATFEHIARVNSRLVARDAAISMEFGRGISCGHAWMFRPQERHLGQMNGRRFEHRLGGLESGRTYAMLMEVSLPPENGPSTQVGCARLSWRRGRGWDHHTVTIDAPRLKAGAASPQQVDFVHQAYAVLDDPRRKGDRKAELDRWRAKRTLAELEGRDSRLIDAINKQIDVLEGKLSPAEIRDESEQLLQADQSTSMADVVQPSRHELERELRTLTDLYRKAVDARVDVELILRLENQILDLKKKVRRSI